MRSFAVFYTLKFLCNMYTLMGALHIIQMDLLNILFWFKCKHFAVYYMHVSDEFVIQSSARFTPYLLFVLYKRLLFIQLLLRSMNYYFCIKCELSNIQQINGIITDPISSNDINNYFFILWLAEYGDSSDSQFSFIFSTSRPKFRWIDFIKTIFTLCKHVRSRHIIFFSHYSKYWKKKCTDVFRLWPH